jgi:hypothetical protein
MMKHILFFLAFFPSVLLAQEQPKLANKFALRAESVWHADLLGNVYIADKDLLVKYDTTGAKQYSQSIKSLGRINAILSVNTMRIVLFSELQQTFTIMDNTLSEAAKTYDLSELDFGYVSKMTVSSQPNKFWIYDQSNSRLVLLDLSRTNQQQEIGNVRGILNSTEVTWMKEDNNKLYLFDSKKQLYIFDLYGSLIDVMHFPEVNRIEVFQNQIFVISTEGVQRYRQEDATFEKIELEGYGIQEFQWSNNSFFIQIGQELMKYKF